MGGCVRRSNYAFAECRKPHTMSSIDKCIETSGTNQCLLDGIGIGDGVVIQGLVKRPELNSQSGVVKALSQELGRVVVELDEGDGGAPAAVKVKPSNVEVAEEATPLDLASLLLDAQAQALAHPDTFAAPSASDTTPPTCAPPADGYVPASASECLFGVTSVSQ